MVPILSCPKKRDIVGIAAALANVLARLDQHAARTAGRVVDAHPRLRVDDFDEHADDLGGRVELAALLAGGVGEELDQVLVGRAEQVGKLEVLVAQRDLLEILDEVRQRVVVERALADLAVEVDVLEHVLKRIDVGRMILDRFERFVETRADIGFQMADLRPAGFLRAQRKYTGPDSLAEPR